MRQTLNSQAYLADPRRALTVRRPKVDRRARQLAGLAALLVGVFGVLAFLLHRAEGTVADVFITRAIQQLDHPALTWTMVAVSALGYAPTSGAIFWGAVLGLAILRFWREALFVLATHAAGVATAAIKLLVDRPRPTDDVVNVWSRVGEMSFPSGHVVSYVTFYGFLFFLLYALGRRSIWRTLGLALLAVPVLTVGVSRVYLGHHWASDVLGGYAFGTAFLLLQIVSYRVLVSERSAPLAPPASAASASEVTVPR